MQGAESALRHSEDEVPVRRSLMIEGSVAVCGISCHVDVLRHCQQPILLHARDRSRIQLMRKPPTLALARVGSP